MTRTLLVAGTASHVGKSTVVAGLCRHLADRGVDVAPFKAQNMSNNARVALTPDGAWGEVGVSQHVQARAAGVVPRTDHNPVLLKPRGDGESQLVIDGEAVGHFRAGEYYDEHWTRARVAAEAAYGRLAADHDVIVAEGAGGLGEVNLHHRDLANVETARFADADVLVLADIERGGAFASLFGTLELAPEDVRERVVAAAITKFRGDASLLDDGIEAVESRTGVPVAGVLPYDDPGLPAEDSVDLPPPDERRVVAEDDGVPQERAVTVAVPRLPRISNFTDLAPLAREPGVRVAHVPLDDTLANADAVVLPGTKNAVDDLLAARAAGLDEAIAGFDGPVVGVCGGYQLLGERLANASLEGTRGGTGPGGVEGEDRDAPDAPGAGRFGDEDAVPGLGLLPVETAYATEKTVERVRFRVDGCGPLAGAAGTVEGYEIHHGETVATAAVDRPLGRNSARLGPVVGTYLHGLFENDPVRDAFVESVFEAAGRPRPSGTAAVGSPFDAAASLVREHLDLGALGFDA